MDEPQAVPGLPAIIAPRNDTTCTNCCIADAIELPKKEAGNMIDVYLGCGSNDKHKLIGEDGWRAAKVCE